ncbi:methyltransferase [Streptomyces sp. NPDC050504]|uniref:methyltransferase n=1 Tax=Streptomyces sp. NPDC050504 TaxID=3365618 RepID=UPI0037ADEB52
MNGKTVDSAGGGIVSEDAGTGAGAGTGVSYDVVVVGGGAAGLSGALTLARARRRVLVVDSGEPRNAPAAHMHGYLGSDGIDPALLLAAGRDEVKAYGGELVQGQVVDVARDGESGAFRVVLDDGTVHTAARLLVTTGLVDVLPEVPGLAGRWGRDVLHCPYCHGYEARDAAVGVLATGPRSVHQALLWRQWSADVTFFAHTYAHALADEERERLEARGIAVVEGEVSEVLVEGDAVRGVRLGGAAPEGAEGTASGGAEGGVVRECSALVVAPELLARDGFLGALGIGGGGTEPVAVDATGATEAAGVWAAGNVVSPHDQVLSAAAAGSRAAAAINADLVEEETARAVAHRRGTEFWDGFYGEKDRIWSGNPNVVLVREAAGLAPGRALDLGCGEGADAVWLARQGWRVTGVDISRVALERAAGHAADAGEEVASRIDWQRHDLAETFPEGEFDLVSVQFLHSTVELPRERILYRAARAVAAGGVLLIEGHGGFPSWDEEARARHEHVHFPTPEEVVESLELPEGEWEVVLSEEHERTQKNREGVEGTRIDSTVLLRRR